jgi:adenine-specific DNA-methyltransferase
MKKESKKTTYIDVLKTQFQELLTELFQLNNTDLDFGIYRIMNLKSEEIKIFIEEKIPEKIELVKKQIIDRESIDVKKELDDVKKELEKKFEINFQDENDIDLKANQYGQLPLFKEPFSRYKLAKEKLSSLRVSEETEKSVYDELHRFFERYYEGGDFISKPRAGKNNYMIPYEGEEVKLYWANYDQYYIKSGDNFKNYIFNNQSNSKEKLTTVEFKIIDAEVAINNNKEEKGRCFVPTEEPLEWLVDERKLLIKFYYKVPNTEEKQKWGESQSVKKDNKGINQKLAAFVSKQIIETKDDELILFLNSTKKNRKDEEISIFFYHLERYTSVNKFDYFIHKDLRGFLTRELDTFIKNDVFQLSFLDKDWPQKEVEESIRISVLKASVIREVALEIIDFVSEFEAFQKRLFEKKKFVVESHYCITLDRIPEPIYDDVINFVLTDSTKNQIKDWIELKFIEGNELDANPKKAKGEDEFTNAKTYLKENDKLIIDTKFLPENLKWKLLGSFNDLEEIITGIFINSENFQALNFLEKKYKNRIKATYIDPPYNTGNDDFLYKDNYQHSSWLSMMNDRFEKAKRIIGTNGAIFSQINEKELNHLIKLQEKVFGQNFIQTITVKTATPAGFKTVNPGAVSVSEYITWFTKSRQNFEFKKVYVECNYQKDYNKYIENFEAEPEDWIYVSVQKKVLENLGLKSPNEAKKKYGEAIAQAIINESIAQFALENASRIFTTYAPHKPSGVLKDLVEKSRIEKDVILVHKRELNLDPFIVLNGRLFAFYSNKLKEINGKMVPTQLLSDFWDDLSWDSLSNEGGVTFKNGKKPELLIKRIMDMSNLLDDDIILDYFGGSATTASAATKSKVKWISIEMASYFDDLCIPRLKNVLNGEQTGISKNVGWNGGGIFQYLRLEQYEDTLNNIEINQTAPQLDLYDNIRYQLTYGTKGSDSLINLEKFSKPFDYSMKIVFQNEPKEGTKIDLITTFNFLLGIDVNRYILEELNGLSYRIVKGIKGLQSYIIIWRNFDLDKINLKEEKEFITQKEWYDNSAFIYCNCDNAFSAHPIEPEFIRLMNEPVE